MWLPSWVLQLSWHWCPGPTGEPFSSLQPLITMSSALQASLELCSNHGVASGDNIVFRVPTMCRGHARIGASLLLYASTPKPSGHCKNPFAPLFPIGYHWVCPSKLATCEDQHYLGPSISAYKCKPRPEKTLYE